MEYYNVTLVIQILHNRKYILWKLFHRNLGKEKIRHGFLIQYINVWSYNKLHINGIAGHMVSK